jgi:signal transduction histidine kinase
VSDLSALRERLRGLDDGAPDAPERLATMVELAWAGRFGDWSPLEAIADDAYRLATASGQTEIRARAGRVLLLYRRWRHDLEGALEVALATLADFRQLGDRHGEAAVLDSLSTIAQALGDYPAAFEYGREALDVASASGDAVRQGWALASLGAIHSACGEHDEAVRILERGYDVFRSVPDPLGMARIDLRLGALLLERGDVEGARQRFRAIVDGRRGLPGDLPNIAWGGLADVARVEGRLAEARRLYEKAEEALGRLGARAMIDDNQLSMTRLCLEEGALDEAHERLSAMRRHHEHSGFKPMLAQIHELLAEVCERRGEPNEALAHHKRLGELRQQIAREETRATMLHARSRQAIESAKKDAEIHRLRYVELANMQAKLVASEKLAALGHLSAGIAHELNNPLGALKSNIELIDRVLERIARELGDSASPRMAKSLRSATDAARTSALAVDRVAGFVRNVTRFSGVDRAALETTDLRDCIESVLEMLRPSMPPSIRVTKRLSEVPSVWANPARVNQALMAVVIHAVEAMREEGELTVELSAELDDEVVVRITDDGPGVGPDELDRIFDVGFAEGDERVHVSFGLPTAAATMKAFGGSAEAHSEVGRGTTVALRFPIGKHTAT